MRRHLSIKYTYSCRDVTQSAVARRIRKYAGAPCLRAQTLSGESGHRVRNYSLVRRGPSSTLVDAGIVGFPRDPGRGADVHCRGAGGGTASLGGDYYPRDTDIIRH